MEAVIFDRNGKEVDWYDPVDYTSVRETKHYWIIQLTNFVSTPYRIYKREGYTLQIRKIESPE